MQSCLNLKLLLKKDKTLQSNSILKELKLWDFVSKQNDFTEKLPKLTPMILNFLLRSKKTKMESKMIKKAITLFFILICIGQVKAQMGGSHIYYNCLPILKREIPAVEDYLNINDRNQFLSLSINNELAAQAIVTLLEFHDQVRCLNLNKLRRALGDKKTILSNKDPEDFDSTLHNTLINLDENAPALIQILID